MNYSMFWDESCNSCNLTFPGLMETHIKTCLKPSSTAVAVGLLAPQTRDRPTCAAIAWRVIFSGDGGEG